ncbi:hypothetical protein INR77_11590 [Erythrobacter sp. SCSIO 43205]|uniref:hypothetical protein n=1 Tax=Erythrobacter sp. SCSIO 43205 TaxID=2779361 RepID=UPI001CAA3ECE|nr:hypothetical protein [Erythrobacter sp. SCSIO 43205]UAB77438.1 hypothetical protein INR77_11590 [Erythrobacter sp. SCSIO 43205]
MAVTAAWKTAAKVASLAANSIVAFGASTAANVIQAAKASVNTSQAITPTLFEAIEADCRFLEEHPTFADLSRARLWLNPPAPACWRKEWDNARKWLSLPGYNFQIWREWYYGRIEGLPHAFADFDNEADGKFYRWIVEQDDNWWSREPAVVNAEITEFVDALRITAPTDEELRQNPRAFTFSLDEEGRSELDEETLPNGLQGDPDERDNHSEILRLIEIALLATAAQTNAKDMEEPTRLLKEAVGEDVEALRPRLFILRAREIIRQVDERESGDSLNPQLSEKQRDAYLPLVEALKMIAEFSPKLAELWHGKLGQTGTPLTREMLDLIAEALRTTGQTTALAQSVIEASNALVAPDAPEDDPARVAASETSRNAFRKMGGTLKKAGEGAKDAENIISLGERLFKIAGIVRDKLPSGEVIARIIASFGGG